MNKLIFLSILILFAGCSSDDPELEDSSNSTLGYYKGMSRSDY